jgi:hypothetical protein
MATNTKQKHANNIEASRKQDISTLVEDLKMSRQEIKHQKQVFYQKAYETKKHFRNKNRDVEESWQKERTALLDQITDLQRELDLKSNSTRSPSTLRYNGLKRPEAASKPTHTTKAHESKCYDSHLLVS